MFDINAAVVGAGFVGPVHVEAPRAGKHGPCDAISASRKKNAWVKIKGDRR
ncbi:MAG: hypothetical protein WC869_14655 [Phycisphaerae bacterium]|jgi:hypothetical protein